MPVNVAPFFAGWRQMNERLIEVMGSLSADELAWAPAPHMWPIWALAGHLAGMRPYWLCHVLGEPGAETTPVHDPTGEGWEDDLSRPRDSGELTQALRSTWLIVEGCLERWTPRCCGSNFAGSGAARSSFTPGNPSYSACSPTTRRIRARSRRRSGATAKVRSIYGPVSRG